MNLNIGYNPFSQNSVFNNKSLENLQAKADYFKEESTDNNNYEEVVIWKENYFANTQNINEPRGPKYKCNECNEIFNTRLSFLTHSKFHRKPLCILCGKYFTAEKEMYGHMKSFHSKFVRFQRTQTIKYENSSIYQNISNCSLTESYLNEQLLNNYGQNSSSGKLPRKVGRPRKDIRNQQQQQQQQCDVIEKPKQTITSRSGRCITMKVLDY